MGDSQLGKALGTDYELVARWVSAHEQSCGCPNPDVGWTGRCARCFGRAVEGYSVSQIANHVGVGDGKAAIALRYAAREGLAEKRVTDEGDLWFPTALAYETFPADRAHVMPEPESVELEGGTFTPMRSEEIRAQSDRLMPPAAAGELVAQDLALGRRSLADVEEDAASLEAFAAEVCEGDVSRARELLGNLYDATDDRERRLLGDGSDS